MYCACGWAVWMYCACVHSASALPCRAVMRCGAVVQHHVCLLVEACCRVGLWRPGAKQAACCWSLWASEHRALALLGRAPWIASLSSSVTALLFPVNTCAQHTTRARGCTTRASACTTQASAAATATNTPSSAGRGPGTRHDWSQCTQGHTTARCARCGPCTQSTRNTHAPFHIHMQHARIHMTYESTNQCAAPSSRGQSRATPHTTAQAAPRHAGTRGCGCRLCQLHLCSAAKV
jgi:hypothetical protein